MCLVGRLTLNTPECVWVDCLMGPVNTDRGEAARLDVSRKTDSVMCGTVAVGRLACWASGRAFWHLSASSGFACCVFSYVLLKSVAFLAS